MYRNNVNDFDEEEKYASRRAYRKAYASACKILGHDRGLEKYYFKFKKFTYYIFDNQNHSVENSDKLVVAVNIDNPYDFFLRSGCKMYWFYNNDYDFYKVTSYEGRELTDIYFHKFLGFMKRTRNCKMFEMLKGEDDPKVNDRYINVNGIKMYNNQIKKEAKQIFKKIKAKRAEDF